MLLPPPAWADEGAWPRGRGSGEPAGWSVMSSGSRERRVFWPSGSCRPPFSSHDDEFFLPLLSRGSHASSDDSSKPPRKNRLPVAGERLSGAFFIMKVLYITFSAKIKALWRCK